MDTKIILTDVDGVLLDWFAGFKSWMSDHGHEEIAEQAELHWDLGHRYGKDDAEIFNLVEEFNHSEEIKNLTPIRDAQYWVGRLEEEGFKLHCVSSLSDSERAERFRLWNLYQLFGEDVFDDIVCLPILQCKRDYLSKFKDSGMFWIEDNIKNAEVGHELGLKTLLMNHGYTQSYNNPEIPLVNDWSHIYDIVA
jgi:FMN phosphatase YigB (HAD superfamily)